MSEPLNGNYIKLRPCDAGDIAPAVMPLLIAAESVVATFKAPVTTWCSPPSD